MDFMGPSHNTNLSLIPVTESELSEVNNQLNNSGTGYAGITAPIIKSTSLPFPVSCFICATLHLLRVYLDKLKTAKVLQFTNQVAKPIVITINQYQFYP